MTTMVRIEKVDSSDGYIIIEINEGDAGPVGARFLKKQGDVHEIAVYGDRVLKITEFTSDEEEQEQRPEQSEDSNKSEDVEEHDKNDEYPSPPGE